MGPKWWIPPAVYAASCDHRQKTSPDSDEPSIHAPTSDVPWGPVERPTQLGLTPGLRSRRPTTASSAAYRSGPDFHLTWRCAGCRPGMPHVVKGNGLIILPRPRLSNEDGEPRGSTTPPRFGDLLLHFGASPDFLVNMRLAFMPFMLRSGRSPDHRTTGITGASQAHQHRGPRLPAP